MPFTLCTPIQPSHKLHQRQINITLNLQINNGNNISIIPAIKSCIRLGINNQPEAVALKPPFVELYTTTTTIQHLYHMLEINMSKLRISRVPHLRHVTPRESSSCSSELHACMRLNP